MIEPGFFARSLPLAKPVPNRDGRFGLARADPVAPQALVSKLHRRLWR